MKPEMNGIITYIQGTRTVDHSASSSGGVSVSPPPGPSTPASVALVPPDEELEQATRSVPMSSLRRQCRGSIREAKPNFGGALVAKLSGGY